jgi:hypothetical protein
LGRFANRPYFEAGKIEFAFRGRTLCVKKDRFVAGGPALVNRQTHHERRIMYPAAISRLSLPWC